MAYTNTAAIIRHDINTYVLEAQGVEQGLIAPLVLPPLAVEAKAGIYPKIRIAKGELLKIDETRRAPGTSYNRVSRTWETDNYECVDRGLEEPIDDGIARDMKRFFELEKVTAVSLMRNMLLGEEQRAAQLIQNPSNFNSTNSSVAYSEANVATIDFVKDMTDALTRLSQKGVMPNTLVVSLNMWNRLRRSTKLQNYLYGTLVSATDRSVKMADVAAEFGLEQILVGRVAHDTAKKGQASASLSSLWSDSYIWLGNVKAGDFREGGAGRTITWNEGGDFLTTETYRDEQIKSDIIRVSTFNVQKVVDGTAGELIATQV